MVLYMRLAKILHLTGNSFQLYCKIRGLRCIPSAHAHVLTRDLFSRSNTMQNKKLMASLEDFFYCIDCSKTRRHVSKVRGSLEASTL